MNLCEVKLVRTEVEPGWPLMATHVAPGKRYVVDLDRTEELTMLNKIDGRSIAVRCFWVVSPEPEGFLPAMAFGL